MFQATKKRAPWGALGANGRPVLVGCGGCTATALLRPARASFGLKPMLTAIIIGVTNGDWKLYWWEDYVRRLSVVCPLRFVGNIPELEDLFLR